MAIATAVRQLVTVQKHDLAHVDIIVRGMMIYRIRGTHESAGQDGHGSCSAAAHLATPSLRSVPEPLRLELGAGEYLRWGAAHRLATPVRAAHDRKVLTSRNLSLSFLQY